MLEKYFVAKAVLQIVPHVKQTSLHESAIFSQYYNLNILPHLRCPQRQTLTFSRLTRRVKLSIEMWATFTLPKLAKNTIQQTAACNFTSTQTKVL